METFGQATVDQSRYRNNYRGRGNYRGGNRGGNNNNNNNGGQGYYRNNRNNYNNGNNNGYRQNKVNIIYIYKYLSVICVQYIDFLISYKASRSTRIQLKKIILCTCFSLIFCNKKIYTFQKYHPNNKKKN